MPVYLLQQLYQLPDSVAQGSTKDASPSAGLNNQPFPEKYVLSWERARFREIPQYINDCVWRVPDFLSKVGLSLGESRDLELCDLDPESDAELDEEMGEAKDLRQARNRLKLGKIWFNDAVYSMLNADRWVLFRWFHKLRPGGRVPHVSAVRRADDRELLDPD